MRKTRLLLISIALMGVAVVLGMLGSRDSGPETAGEQAAAPAPVAETRVGRVAGTEAFIAVRYDGSRLRAYACDGSARRPATLSKWFEARWDGGEPVTLVNGEAKLVVERLHADGRITGRLDGHRFAADPATGPAGLHERDRRRTIVLADGSQRGTFIPTRPPRCRIVLVTTASGQTQYVTVC